ncbi:hypothetical protein DDB_G0287479 [Dictyostelium discoideum AX4]|uniref:Uncharacterized protein n=1 Tax=Dictyostelium discoideum TaxID=44689 RepID=Q54KA6_DICDI|nr:hypothetical protein DDB_G0287479 [Dictyostelium discoideum AX4]EAL63705.1 hypothetical protein DDB_G0287479 [Dictyostelium discoideum AX4]|eukprot:XP_637215.1 hypothetical protein DDB_G0287479 [Dictyostelium discoideum AX4]
MFEINFEIINLFKKHSNKFNEKLLFTIDVNDKILIDKSNYENVYLNNRKLVINKLIEKKVKIEQLSIELLRSFGYYILGENENGEEDPQTEYSIVPYEEFIEIFETFKFNENETIRLFISLQHFQFFNNKSIFNRNEFFKYLSSLLLDDGSGNNVIPMVIQFYNKYYHKSTNISLNQRNTSDLLQMILSDKLKLKLFFLKNNQFKIFNLLITNFNLSFLLKSLLANKMCYNEFNNKDNQELNFILKFINIIKNGLKITNEKYLFNPIFKYFNKMEFENKNKLKILKINKILNNDNNKINNYNNNFEILPNEIIIKIIIILITYNRNINHQIPNLSSSSTSSSPSLILINNLIKSKYCIYLSTFIFNEIKNDIFSIALTNWKFYNMLSHCLNFEINWHKMQSQFKIGYESFFYYEIQYGYKYCLFKKPISIIDYKGLIYSTPFNKVSKVFTQLEYLSFDTGLYFSNNSNNNNNNNNNKFDIWDTTYYTFPIKLPNLKFLKIIGRDYYNNKNNNNNNNNNNNRNYFESVYNKDNGKFLDLIKWILIHTNCKLEHVIYSPIVGCIEEMDKDSIIEPLFKNHGNNLKSFKLVYFENDQLLKYINYLNDTLENYPKIKFIHKKKNFRFSNK